MCFPAETTRSETTEPVKEIGFEIAEKHGIIFHTGARTAFGHVPINVDECHIADALSVQRPQAERPQGNRLPYISVPASKTRSFIHGGAQGAEAPRRYREYVPGIVRLRTGRAEIADERRWKSAQQEKESSRVTT
ncbi:MAG: hypothetical protein ACLT76_10650 [Clostridium fessum]